MDLEGDAHGGFAGGVETGELAEDGVVGFDGLAGRFEVEGGQGLEWAYLEVRGCYRFLAVVYPL